jgi:hypothetical protein
METTIEPTQPMTKTMPKKIEAIKAYPHPEIKFRYILCRKSPDDPTANLLDDLIIRCNQKDFGATIDFSTIVAYSLRLLTESDILEIQNNSLSDQERVQELVNDYNIKHGTNLTMFEFVLNGLNKKSKKGVNQ